MKPLSKREEVTLNLLRSAGVECEILQITATGLSKGYTDAVVAFRNFLKKTGIHDFDLQEAGEEFIKRIDVYVVTTEETDLLKVSLQRPATGEGRFYRLSMLGGLKGPLNIIDGDILLFFVRENQLAVANLTHLSERVLGKGAQEPRAKPEKGATIIAIAKNRILHVMENMPECEPERMGARASEIADLSGMTLEKQRGAIVNSLLDELCLEQKIEVATTTPRRYRLCP